MKSSLEFDKFGKWFIQYIDTIASTIEGMIDFVLDHFKGDERARLRAFLDDVTQDGILDGDLLRLWNATQADVTFRTGADLRAMLRKARDRL